MWDATPMPLPLDAYIDTWHGELAVRWLEEYDRDEPFFAFVGFPGPHDPWDAPTEAIARWGADDVTMPTSTRAARPRRHRPLRRSAQGVPAGSPTPRP